jgi:hypothetical protein
MYSLRVSPALSACINNVFFSPVVVRIWILSVVPCARLGRGIAFSFLWGSRGAALSEMRNHFSE